MNSHSARDVSKKSSMCDQFSWSEKRAAEKIEKDARKFAAKSVEELRVRGWEPKWDSPSHESSD